MKFEMDDVARKYYEIDDKKKELAKKHAKEMEPYNAALKTIEAAIEAYLVGKAKKYAEQGIREEVRLKTNHGTWWREIVTYPQIPGHDEFIKFLNWCVDQRGVESVAQYMNRSGVSLTAVNDYTETHKKTPPGMNTVTEIKLRKRKK